MKLKEGLVIRPLGSQYVVIATGALTNTFDGALRFNDVGASIYNLLKEETTKEEMIDILQKQYNVEKEVVEENVDAFLNLLRTNHLLDE